MENASKYIDRQTLDFVFSEAERVLVEDWRRQYRKRIISAQVGIDRKTVLDQAKQVLLKMEDAGVSIEELIEWLDNKEEIRTGVVRANIQNQ